MLGEYATYSANLFITFKRKIRNTDKVQDTSPAASLTDKAAAEKVFEVIRSQACAIVDPPFGTQDKTIIKNIKNES